MITLYSVALPSSGINLTAACSISLFVHRCHAILYVVLYSITLSQREPSKLVLCLRESQRVSEWVSDCVCSSDWVLNICANGRTRRERALYAPLPASMWPTLAAALYWATTLMDPTLRISSNGASWWRIKFFFRAPLPTRCLHICSDNIRCK